VIIRNANAEMGDPVAVIAHMLLKGRGSLDVRIKTDRLECAVGCSVDISLKRVADTAASFCSRSLNEGG
jgi:hypothetical protein